MVAQLVHLVVEQFLTPILFSSHASRRSLVEAEVTWKPSRKWLLQFPSEQLSGYNELGVFREEWSRSIVFDRTSIFSSGQDWCRPYTACFDVSSMFFYACIVHDAVHSSRSYQDPYGSCPWDLQAERILSVCCSSFDLQVSIPNWWWNVNWLHIRHGKCTGRSCPEWQHCPVE